jgi:hypothetical protein
VTTDKLSPFTHFGLPGIDRVPVGMHACHFYGNRDQLVAALVPYFAAGLANNERCLWITAPPLPAGEAVAALRQASDRVDEAILSGALRVFDFDQWYTDAAGVKGLEVVEMWLREEERALADGYSGLRISGNASFVKPDDWPAFLEYERALTARLAGRRVLTLCSYPQSCNDHQVSEVTSAHTCELQHAGNDWQVLAGAEFLRV